MTATDDLPDSGLQTADVETEGARIVFDVEGTGPLLLCIAGGGGDAPRHAGISAILKDQYRVVRYDRRCNSRSTGDRDIDLDMAQQARDAVAVIKALGAPRAWVFGNSAGANIALKIAEDHPEMVAGMVVHEPPVLPILPDAQHWFDFDDRVEEVFRAQGAGSAMMLFATSLVGFPKPSGPPGKPGLLSQGPGRAAANGEAAVERIGERSSADNLDFFFAHEFHNVGRYAPDLDRIKANGVAMVLVQGRASEDAYYARTGRIVAERVGCPYREMSGNHIAFVSDPATFAAELRAILDEMKGEATA